MSRALLPMAILLLAGLALVAAAPASAADPRIVALGREIVGGAGLPPDFACARCHGVQGQGKPEEGAPRLAGQPQLYLEKQLRDFAAGTRQSDKMQPVARALDPAQRLAVAAYFAALHDVPYPPAPEGAPAVIQDGGVLSAIGDDAREIRPCELCHADAGVGIAPGFPYLAGQYAAYTAEQLRAWREGRRRNDPLDVMAEIARALREDEIEALALYFARIRPPAAVVSSPIPEAPIPPPPVQ
jgi:cytochrome c553